MVPHWLQAGCGVASAVFLLLLFAGGAFLTGDHIAGLADLLLGTTMSELKSRYASDIPAQDRAAFDREVEKMRESLRDGRLSMQAVLPFLKGVQSAMRDQRVTAGELRGLTESARTANRSPGQPAGHRPLATPTPPLRSGSG